MKSLLALHLLALLLLQLVTMQLVGQTLAAVGATETSSKATTRQRTTTTTEPPSLRAPHRSVAATTRVMSTQRRRTPATSTTTTTTNKPPTSTTTLRALTASAARRQRPPIARSTSSLSTQPPPSTSSSSTTTRSTAYGNRVRNLAAAIDKAKMDEKSKQQNSARPLRSINNAQTRTSGARQNRSLQSAQSSSLGYAAAITANPQSGNSLTIANNKPNEQKHERVDRRYHLRTTTTATTTSTTNQRSSNETTTLASDASNIASSTAEKHHLPVNVVVASHHRSRHQQHQQQPKESSMPSAAVAAAAAAVDTKLKQQDVANDAMDAIKQAPQSDKQQNEAATKQRQTAKSPRMIHRLVAGHIQNAEGRSTYQVSAVTSNSSVSTSSTSTTSKPKVNAETQRHITRPTKSSAKYSAQITTTSAAMQPKPVKLQTILDEEDARQDNDDDEALLDDAGDFDNWDNGILRLSAGSGKENDKKPKKHHNKIDDSKKTLADQVRDGKYGLIEKELFRREPKRPGILSYLPNKEVPIDNERNYGGLPEEDIWLAEDHLLVIKGGSLNEEKPQEEPWPAIDDYDAPGRQIKIPVNPKVPPPFPVQLEENGPVQFIGNNKFTVVYPIANESIPIYTVGPEADHARTEAERENAKDTLTRPGTAQDTASGEPQYVYPAPYPPWLYGNQTFVNPLLSNARPINFPGLGPFPFGRNGSLDNSNGTDFFDEDDPTLYYPPAYSFVYKNNYTNPVPPGPLVPGIVLPPPANHFSRLEKPDKSTPTTPRTRLPPTTPSTTTTAFTSTTTSTTIVTPVASTTSETPLRPFITKIEQYTPKIINITPAPTPTVSAVLPSTTIVKIPVSPSPAPPSTPKSPPSTSSNLQFEPVPVPVAVPIPISIYPSRKYPTSRPSLISFVPTKSQQSSNTLSKSNPIYYEYFEAKRQPIKTNVIDDFLATTVDPPPAPKPIKLYAASKRPHKQHHNYIQQLPTQRKPFKENVVYITPKPDVRYKSPTSKLPLLKQRPLENFDREVDALRETLRYYQNQQLRDNSIPRTPKVKPIYEFSFDATKNLQRAENDFRPPVNFDDEPFKPMVTYSPPMNDENSFSPMAYDKVDAANSQQLAPESKQIDEQPQKYQSTTTLIPVQPDAEYQLQPQSQQGRLKKQRLSAKYLQEPFYEPEPDPYNNQRPWIAIGKTTDNNYDEPPIAQQRSPGEQTQRFEQYQQYGLPKHRSYGGYYYGPPPPPALTPNSRQNNRFYDEPFRKINNYQRPRPNVHYQAQQQHQQQQQHQPQKQQQQQQNYWNLENDTYVNYAPNRPPLNPDAEFIDPYQTLPINPYAAGHGRYPALSHQSQYYAPPSRPIPLHRDILVNYRQPLPPINPDSEFITHPHVVRHQGNQIYRSDSYQRLPTPPLPPPLLDNGDEQANLYYSSPKYRRANANNNNNNNNGGGEGAGGIVDGNNNAANVNRQARERRSSSDSSEIINNEK